MDRAPQSEREGFLPDGISIRVQVPQLGEVNGALAREPAAGALYLECALPYPMGACVPVRLIDPRTLEQVPAECEVVRQIKDAAGKVTGLGLRFTHLDAGLVQKLRALGGDASVPASLTEIPLDAVPTVVQTAADPPLHPMETLLLKLVDGKRSADGIAQASGLSLVEALAGLMQLRRRGVIRLVVAGPDAQQSFAGDKVREYLSEAVRSERGGRAAEAVSLLEQALAINPPNRRDIHVRLCRLALGPLANLALARRHLEAILSEDPAAGEAKELAEKIAAREKELAAPKAKAAKVVVKTPATGLSGRRKLWGLGGALLLVATLGVNVWIWLVPRGERPKTVRVEMVAAILPTESARLFRNRLYITVAPEWHELAEVEQKARLARVFEWARKTYAAQEVLASDRKPVLVGKVARGQVVVYRGKR